MKVSDMNPVQAIDVYQSPEFQAFCKRFGIAHELQTMDMVLTITFKEGLVVTQTYRATEGPRPVTMETTTLHNDEYETHQLIKDK